jgi:hypothetical protein
MGNKLKRYYTVDLTNENQIGEGRAGDCIVYKGVRKLDSKEVAIKIVKKDKSKKNEKKKKDDKKDVSNVKLSHPFIVDTLEIIKDGNDSSYI